MAKKDPWKLPVWVTRDLVAYVLGSAVVVHEVFMSNLDRQWPMIGAAALMGLPWIARLDARRRDAGDKGD